MPASAELSNRVSEGPSMSLGQFNSGDPEAFRRTYPFLVRFAERFMNGQSGAEDLVQNALTKAINPLRRKVPEDFEKFGGSVVPYLKRAIVNSKVDVVRRRHGGVDNGFEVELDETKLVDGSEAVADVVERRVDGMLELEKIRAGVKDVFVAALYLVEGEGLSYQEAGVRLGVPMGTVQSRVHRAKIMARAALGEAS